MAIGKVIGKKLDHGFPGSFAIQPDQLIDSHVNAGTTEIAFGVPVKYKEVDGFNGVENLTTVSDTVVGITVREVKQGDSYFNQGQATYKPKDAVAVMKRGNVSVLVVSDISSVKHNGNVYYRVVASSDKPIGFVAASGTDTVELKNCRFSGTCDAHGVVSVAILEKANA